MVCTFDSRCATVLFRKQLDFPCNSDWADVTCSWSEPRKRKMPKKKDLPALPHRGGRAQGRPGEAMNKRRNPVYMKTMESRSAGHIGRFQKNGDDNYMEVYRETVKCNVVNFQALGSSSHFRMSSDMLKVNPAEQQLPNGYHGSGCHGNGLPGSYPGSVWGEVGSVDDSVLTHRSDQSVGSTINLDSGHKQNRFHKEQLLTQLHERSAPLLKYLFAEGNTARNSELHVDNISLPIRQVNSKSMANSQKVKHVILEPKDYDQIGEDYVGALIPNSSRPLGYGLLRSPRSMTLSHKTLELPTLCGSSKIFLPPVNPPPHPIRTCVDEPKKIPTGKGEAAHLSPPPPLNNKITMSAASAAALSMALNPILEHPMGKRTFTPLGGGLTTGREVGNIGGVGNSGGGVGATSLQLLKGGDHVMLDMGDQKVRGGLAGTSAAALGLAFDPAKDFNPLEKMKVFKPMRSSIVPAVAAKENRDKAYLYCNSIKEQVEEGSAYIDSVSQLVGMLCIEPTNNSALPQHTIQKWLDT